MIINSFEFLDMIVVWRERDRERQRARAYREVHPKMSASGMVCLGFAPK